MSLMVFSILLHIEIVVFFVIKKLNPKVNEMFNMIFLWILMLEMDVFNCTRHPTKERRNIEQVSIPFKNQLMIALTRNTTSL